ncbi:MAG: hypothetical protein V8S38_06745 [Lachnospiraceae bacterium]
MSSPTHLSTDIQEAAELLASELKAKGEKVVIYDLARCDTAQAVADAFRYSKLVLATITYNAGTTHACVTLSII